MNERPTIYFAVLAGLLGAVLLFGVAAPARRAAAHEAKDLHRATVRTAPDHEPVVLVEAGQPAASVVAAPGAGGRMVHSRRRCW